LRIKDKETRLIIHEHDDDDSYIIDHAQSKPNVEVFVMICWSRDSSVSIVTMLRAVQTGFDSRWVKKFFPSPKFSDFLGNKHLPILCVMGFLYLEGRHATVGWVHLVPRLRMNVAALLIFLHVIMSWTGILIQNKPLEFHSNQQTRRHPYGVTNTSVA
jgi:hypothetical protein